MNEELNWAVNYELGILDPCIEDPEQIFGGKKSLVNKFHPYQNEHEVKLALKLIFITQDMTETTWALWIGTQMHLQDLFDEDEKDNLQSVSGIELVASKGPRKIRYYVCTAANARRNRRYRPHGVT